MSFATIRRPKPSSIRAQLTLWYVAMLAAALAAFAVFVFSVRAQTLSRELDASLEIDAQRLLRDIRPALLELDVAAALADHPRLAAEPIVVRERTGAVVYRSPAFPPLTGPAEAAAARVARTAYEPIEVDGRSTRVRIVTAVSERTGANPLVLQIAASTDPIQRTLDELALTLLALFGIVLSVASYGGSFIARRALRPVEAINARVREIQASRLGERLDLHTGSGELDGLVATLNGMLDRLDTSMRGARRFAADASHELQTPIAAMRTAVDVCLRGDSDADDYRAMASDLAVDLDRLSALVRDLRLLALADAGHLLDCVERVDVTQVVHECCDIVRAIAEPKSILVSADVLSDMTVQGSALHLRRALLNLMQNAVRYSPERSTVQITVGRLDAEAVVAIVDDGCGIAPEDLPHIFDRFYRADPARARDTGGSGLGLAIADQIVRSHGGRIEVTSAPGQGSTFLLFLPIASADDRHVELQSLRTVNAA